MAATTQGEKPLQLLIGTVEVDLTLSEEHSGASEITKHPVEKGARITDHIRPELETLTMEAMVSNVPLTPADAERYGAAPRGAKGRAEVAHDELRRIKDSAELITVVTKLRTYSGMALKSLRVRKDKTTGDALIFAMAFEQVRQVESQTVQLEAVRTKVVGGKGKVDAGAQVTKGATEAQRRRSMAKKLLERAKEALAK